eukprot:5659292-Amphidinium_carterae.1
MFNGSGMRTFFSRREQVVTCSVGEVFGVPEQLSGETPVASLCSLAVPCETCSSEEVFDQISSAEREDVVGVPKRKSGVTRVAHPAGRANSALSSKELEVALEAPRWTFWSLSTDCLQEDLSSSDDDDFSWASLEQLGGCHGSKACGFDSQ